VSSTNREGRRPDAGIIDYYVTPVDAIVRFLKFFKKIDPYATLMKVLDPCAGGDDKHPMSYPTALIKSGWKDEQIFTLDIRGDSQAAVIKDYFKAKVLRSKFQIIISNPPFILAQEFIEKALKDVINGGWVIMLLRLNFFGSQKRYQFWQNNRPMFAFIHSKRMSFTDKGGTDSIEYMHCVWQKGRKPKYTKVKVI